MATAALPDPAAQGVAGAALAADPRVEACRRMVSRKALLAAGASLVPIPGLDVAADVALLMRLVQQINERFGLSEAQVEALSPSQRALVFKGITLVGSGLIGSAVSRELVLQLLRTVGVRITAKQFTRYIPLAGQAVSAALAYSAMRYVCNQHIADCARVANQLRLASPPVAS
jgi:uncharacterized protein (DUF697 family)